MKKSDKNGNPASLFAAPSPASVGCQTVAFGSDRTYLHEVERIKKRTRKRNQSWLGDSRQPPPAIWPNLPKYDFLRQLLKTTDRAIDSELVGQIRSEAEFDPEDWEYTEAALFVLELKWQRALTQVRDRSMTAARRKAEAEASVEKALGREGSRGDVERRLLEERVGALEEELDDLRNGSGEERERWEDERAEYEHELAEKEARLMQQASDIEGLQAALQNNKMKKTPARKAGGRKKKTGEEKETEKRKRREKRRAEVEREGDEREESRKRVRRGERGDGRPRRTTARLTNYCL